MKCLTAFLVFLLFCIQALRAQSLPDQSPDGETVLATRESSAMFPGSWDVGQALHATTSLSMVASFQASEATGSTAFLPDPTGELHRASEIMEQQETTDRPKPKLLPDNLSFVERSLWGEDGIVRGMGIASPLTPEVRKHELGVRRTMLTIHQVGGFVTLGLMGTAVYYGQMTLNNPSIRSYRNSHQTFVALTIGSYAATGLLAALSPPPLIRRDETSTTTIHKTLAWVHFAGMILTPILGASLKRSFSYDQLAHFHQYSAYFTTAVLAASLIVITF